MKKHHPLLALIALAASSTAAEKPVKVFILAGQSNMVGIGKYPEFKGNVKSVDTRDAMPDPAPSLASERRGKPDEAQ